MEGRVEIYYNGEWGTVCDDFWDLKDAIVACRQLGHKTAVRISHSAEFGEGTGKIWLDDVECNGRESMLSNCNTSSFGTHNCEHSEDAGAVCEGALLHSWHHSIYLKLGISIQIVPIFVLLSALLSLVCKYSLYVGPRVYIRIHSYTYYVIVFDHLLYIALHPVLPNVCA